MLCSSLQSARAIPVPYPPPSCRMQEPPAAAASAAQVSRCNIRQFCTAHRREQAPADDKALEQQARIQELLKEARAAADLPALISGDAVLMRNTQLSNTFTCQPQQRNMHGRIFGGFLMR